MFLMDAPPLGLVAMVCDRGRGCGATCSSMCTQPTRPTAALGINSTIVPSIEVKDAGTTEWNGEYQKNGVFEGCPKFEKIGEPARAMYRCCGAAGTWRLDLQGSHVAYIHDQNGGATDCIIPRIGWRANTNADDPAPTIYISKPRATGAALQLAIVLAVY